jgi:hypothetical protein
MIDKDSFKGKLIKDISITSNLSEKDITLIVEQYESFLLYVMENNPDKVISVPLLGKFLVKNGRKKHWERINKKRNMTREEGQLLQKQRLKQKKDEYRNKTL